MATAAQPIGPHRVIGYRLDDIPRLVHRNRTYRISVVCEEDRHRYTGVFESARAAFDDAMERFPDAHYIGVLRSPR